MSSQKELNERIANSLLDINLRINALEHRIENGIPFSGVGNHHNKRLAALERRMEVVEMMLLEAGND